MYSDYLPQFVAPRMNPSELLAYGLAQTRHRPKRFTVWGVWHNDELVFYAYGRRAGAERWAAEHEWGYASALIVSNMGRA